MRFLKSLNLWLVLAVVGCCVTPGRAAGEANVAATWHFAGSSTLVADTNFDNVKKILTLETSRKFQSLLLDRLADWLGETLFATTNSGADSPLRPLLDDIFTGESVWALGGGTPGSLDFVVALRLDDAHAQAWPAAFSKATGSPGARFKLPGQRWELPGGSSLWAERAKDWLVVCRGDDLNSLADKYLQQISQTGRPVAPLPHSWLEAELDWSQLGQCLPGLPHLFLPGRINATFTTADQALIMSAKVTYPKPIPWKFDPWRIPTNIIHDPLISFSAGQDIAAYMDPDEPLSKLSQNPLAGQYYVWSLDESMVFQTYGAWPVTDATNSLKRVADEAIAAFNPDLQKSQSGELRWQANRDTLLWANLGPLLAPTLTVAPETNGGYLLASFFPLIHLPKSPPDSLYQEILSHTNIVYYDWEGTGHRLVPWQMFSAILPVLPRVALPLPAPGSTNNDMIKRSIAVRGTVLNWLVGVRPLLMGDNTVTVVSRTSPTELSIVRQSTLGFTSLELVLLSHWLTGVGSPGINTGYLPPPAKVTGPGLPQPKSP